MSAFSRTGVEKATHFSLLGGATKAVSSASSIGNGNGKNHSGFLQHEKSLKNEALASSVVSLPDLRPPEMFSIVEPGVYRSSAFSPVHFSFVRSLGLKTIVFLSPEVTIRTMQSFVKDNGIRHVHLGLKFWKPSGWKPMSEEAVKEALEIVLNAKNHPVMVMCTSGIHQTGTLVACLRKLQDWAFSSIIQELRSFEGRARLHTRYLNEHFVERFDVDLITLPSEHTAPSWFLSHLRALEEEMKELQLLLKKPRLESPPRSMLHQTNGASLLSGSSARGVITLDFCAPRLSRDDDDGGDRNHSYDKRIDMNIGEKSSGTSDENSNNGDGGGGDRSFLLEQYYTCGSGPLVVNKKCKQLR